MAQHGAGETDTTAEAPLLIATPEPVVTPLVADGPAISPGEPAAGTHGARPDALALTDGAGEVRPLEEIETDVIRFAIGHYRGQMSEVARRLRIGRSTLYRKLRDLGLEENSGTPDVEAEKSVSAG